jgi:hypothetical protein
MIQVVIPICVAAPGTPVQKFFEEGLKSLLQQTLPVDIWIAADENIPDRIKQVIEDHSLKVKWFPSHSFYRRGSIWKKIWETWKENDSEYVAFMHYDDLWDTRKAELQLRHIEEYNLNGSWTEVYYINKDSNVISGDCSYIQEYNAQNMGTRTAGFAHSCIVSRKELYASEFEKCVEEAARIFEDVWALYMGKIGRVVKTPGAKFFWRDHDMNLSNTSTDHAEYVIAQREELLQTGCAYNEEEIMIDTKNLKPLLEEAYREAISKL